MSAAQLPACPHCNTHQGFLVRASHTIDCAERYDATGTLQEVTRVRSVGTRHSRNRIYCPICDRQRSDVIWHEQQVVDAATRATRE